MGIWGYWVTNLKYSLAKKSNIQIYLKSIAKSACACLLLITGACTNEIPTSSQNIAEKPVKYISYLDKNQKANGVLVKFTSTTSGKSRARSLESAGLVSRGQFALVPGLTLAQASPGLSINQTLENLSNDVSVAYAEPDYIITLDAIPNDADFSMQWGLNSTNDSDIDAPEAWDVTTGNSSVVIAVIDSGVDYNHPDLQNQIWSNPNEIPNNGRDDDANGFIDDVRGWDFATNDNDPMDEHNHGTHVAGVIGAQTNTNPSQGIAGINWNVQIMPLKFMNAQGAGSTSAAIQAIDYAVANGAVVSNNSWGGGGFSQALFDAIQAANRQNHLFVAASGNEGIDTDATPHYPSSYNLPNIISVAASDMQDQLATFSNFGARTVDLAAPGFQIHSTIRQGAYAAFSGTSMASPFVSGVAGLILSQNSSLTVTQLKAAILDNVDPVGGLSGQVATGGRLNAFTSVTGVTAPAPTTPIDPVEITPPSVTTIAVGDSLQLSAVGGDGTYTWATLNPNRAQVDASGLVTAIGNGAARIRVTDGTGLISTPVILSINLPAAATLALNPTSLTQMEINAVVQISVSGGSIPYTWTSSDSAVATIAAGGDSSVASITANGAGTFRVTATDVNGVTINSGLITINAAPALVLGANKTSLNSGETVQLTVSGGTSPYTWNSTNSGAATVNNGGLVSAVGAGRTSISVTDITGATQSVNIEVLSAPPSGNLTVTPADSVISIQSRARLIATGGGSQFTWSSANPAIVSVDSRGIVTGVAEGFSTITVTDENGITGQTNVEVRALSIVAAVLTIGVGDTLQLTATGGQPDYQWSVSNTTAATIDSNGLLTTNANSSVGGILVSATDADNISKSIIVTINNSTILRSPRAF